MCWRLLFIVPVFFSIKHTFAQEPNAQMTFILLMDNEVPTSNISDCFFSIYDTTGIVMDCIPFTYHVGWIELSDSNFKKLITQYNTSDISISFSYNKETNIAFSRNYTEKIPSGWLNDLYLILKVYNYENPESRKKYYLREGTFGIELIMPGAETVIARRG